MAITDMNSIVNEFARGQRIAASTTPKAPQCECDGESSRYCPLHDDCDCCGEVKGTKKDRTLTVAGRPAWVCDECYLLCDDHGEKDCEVCAERAKQPEVRYR